MAGKDAHWQVGADHAGIATQMVVENNLAKKDITRNELGRKKFLDEVWSWKDYSEEKITSQIKSCLLYTSPSPRDGLLSRMPSSA